MEGLSPLLVAAGLLIGSPSLLVAQSGSSSAGDDSLQAPANPY